MGPGEWDKFIHWRHESLENLTLCEHKIIDYQKHHNMTVWNETFPGIVDYDVIPERNWTKPEMMESTKAPCLFR